MHSIATKSKSKHFFFFIKNIFASEKSILESIKSTSKYQSLTMMSHNLSWFSFLIKYKFFFHILFKSFYSRYSIMELRWPVALQPAPLSSLSLGVQTFLQNLITPINTKVIWLFYHSNLKPKILPNASSPPSMQVLQESSQIVKWNCGVSLSLSLSLRVTRVRNHHMHKKIICC